MMPISASPPSSPEPAYEPVEAQADWKGFAERRNFAAAQRMTLLLLASGAIPSAVGVALILITLMGPGTSLGVPALVTGAVLSLAMPTAAAVDSLVKARVEVERIRLESRLADLAIERSRKAVGEAKEDWRATHP